MRAVTPAEEACFSERRLHAVCETDQRDSGDLITLPVPRSDPPAPDSSRPTRILPMPGDDEALAPLPMRRRRIELALCAVLAVALFVLAPRVEPPAMVLRAALVPPFPQSTAAAATASARSEEPAHAAPPASSPKQPIPAPATQGRTDYGF